MRARAVNFLTYMSIVMVHVGTVIFPLHLPASIVINIRAALVMPCLKSKQEEHMEVR